MIKKLRILFKGSFQARLSTESAPTDASPTDPSGAIRPHPYPYPGWTFSYRESKFDRIIRTHSPVELRSALMDPWTAVTVKTVESDDGSGYKTVPSSDQLFGKIVSFGSKVVFDTKSGPGGITHEGLKHFSFTIDDLSSTPAVFRNLDPALLPLLDGDRGGDASWESDYKARKPSLIASAGTMDPERKKVLGPSHSYFETYASYFKARCPTKPFKLKGVLFGKNVSGVLTKLDPPASTKYVWTVQLAFYKFDGDTLTGICDGSVLAEHK